MTVVRGKVVRRLFAKGSKSEHAAVLLDTGEVTLRLRRRGGNPFVDQALDALVGATIRASGTIVDDTMLLDSWTVLPGE